MYEVWLQGDQVFTDRRGNRIARHRPCTAVQAETRLRFQESPPQTQGAVVTLLAPELNQLTYEETAGLDDHYVKISLVEEGVWANRVSDPL